MDKAVIWGVFDFVSFHVCKTLLNKGIEVDGIHLEDTSKIPYLDEKRLEVGRNANFAEYSFSQWRKKIQKQSAENQLFIFSIYDLYMLRQEHLLLNVQVRQTILDYLKKYNRIIEVLFILPMQMLETNEETAVLDFQKQIKNLVEDFKIIYLPSAYGPWQPNVFFIQQAIVAAITDIAISINDREWTEDAVYVEDAAESILELIEEKESGSFIVESGQENYWDKCVTYLNITEQWEQPKRRIVPHLSDYNAVRVPVKKITNLTESLNRQKQHTRMLSLDYFENDGR